MRYKRLSLIILVLLLFAGASSAASLDKARTLRQNGLLDEAKKEAIKIAFSPSSTATQKTEAFLVLGDIAIDEKSFEAARDNWSRVVTMSPDSEHAKEAKHKLDMLKEVSEAATSGDLAAVSFPPGTVLVLPDPDYEWSGVEIAGALGVHARSHTASLTSAVELARSTPNIVGIAQVRLDTSSLYETGNVACYTPTGSKLWDVSVFYNTGGGEEKIARRFVRNLSKKLRGRKCSPPPLKH